jgi:hypothetical protein
MRVVCSGLRPSSWSPSALLAASLNLGFVRPGHQIQGTDRHDPDKDITVGKRSQSTPEEQAREHQFQEATAHNVSNGRRISANVYADEFGECCCHHPEASPVSRRDRATSNPPECN